MGDLPTSTIDAVDVLTTEPPAPDHPFLQANLANLIITPHCAWASREARQAALEQTAGNIETYLNAHAHIKCICKD